MAEHCLRVYQAEFRYKSSDLPVVERLNSHGLALPLYADMTQNDIDKCTAEFLMISKS